MADECPIKLILGVVGHCILKSIAHNSLRILLYFLW